MWNATADYIEKMKVQYSSIAVRYFLKAIVEHKIELS